MARSPAPLRVVLRFREPAGGRMEFRILGPLEVREGGRPLPLGGAKQRAVLAILLLARLKRGCCNLDPHP